MSHLQKCSQGSLKLTLPESGNLAISQARPSPIPRGFSVGLPEVLELGLDPGLPLCTLSFFFNSLRATASLEHWRESYVSQLSTALVAFASGISQMRTLLWLCSWLVVSSEWLYVTASVFSSVKWRLSHLSSRVVATFLSWPDILHLSRERKRSYLSLSQVFLSGRRLKSSL